ncbi:MAG: prolipoprotein diacylglyceryl transferase [Actinomycetota bacterium]|nr:prolipoprotein diacylglyceryl transferase [Actinomycetota bacterium]
MTSLLAAIGWPVLDRVHIGSTFAISPHGVGIALGFLLGAWWLTREGPKRGVALDHINSMVFWALVGAIVGARLFYVIAHYSEFNSIGDMLAVYRGGISLLGGIAGAILVNIPIMRKHGYRFFQVMDGAVIGLAFGIAVGRIGDLIIGDHLGKPTSWALAFQYHGGNLAPPYGCAAGRCAEDLLQGAQQLVVTHSGATLFGSSGQVLARGIGVHQTALYDLVSTLVLFLVLYALNRQPRRVGVLTLTFGAWYGTVRVITDFLRVDKRFFGMTGSQWTGLTVAVICVVTLIVWAIRGRRPRSPDGINGADGDAEARTAPETG